MNTRFTLLLCLSLCLGAAARAQSTPGDPIAENLFPPDLVLQQQRAIALTTEQRDSIQSAAERAQPHIQETEQRVREEVQKLASLISKDQVDESAVLAQSDRINSVERELRRTQLGLLVIIKNRLTPEQQTKLKGLKTRLLVLHSKGDRVEAGVRRWQEQGRDPSSVAQVMQEAEPLIRDGKLDEAEAVLDRALKFLAEANEK
jgi:Spy/CpxP family protein refolding chaperone